MIDGRAVRLVVLQHAEAAWSAPNRGVFDVAVGQQGGVAPGAVGLAGGDVVVVGGTLVAGPVRISSAEARRAAKRTVGEQRVEDGQHARARPALGRVLAAAVTDRVRIGAGLERRVAGRARLDRTLGRRAEREGIERRRPPGRLPAVAQHPGSRERDGAQRPGVGVDDPAGDRQATVDQCPGRAAVSRLPLLLWHIVLGGAARRAVHVGQDHERRALVQNLNAIDVRCAVGRHETPAMRTGGGADRQHAVLHEIVRASEVLGVGPRDHRVACVVDRYRRRPVLQRSSDVHWFADRQRGGRKRKRHHHPEQPARGACLRTVPRHPIPLCLGPGARLASHSGLKSGQIVCLPRAILKTRSGAARRSGSHRL